MGFSINKVPKKFRIPMNYTVLDQETGKSYQETVIHVLKFPSMKLRERFEQQKLQVRGQRLKFKQIQAYMNYWLSIVDHVEGYEEDGINSESSSEDLRKYFSQDLVFTHVQDAILILEDQIGGEDADEMVETRKKSKPQPAQS